MNAAGRRSIRGSTHRAAHGRTRRQMLFTGLIVAMVLVCGGQSLGWSAWLSNSAFGVPSGQVAAASLSTAAAPTAAQTAGAKTVTLSWTSVTDATSYEVLYYTVATGGTGTIVCSPTTTSCVDSTRSGANNWYSVRARVGNKWVGVESARAHYTSDDSTATPTITALGSDTGLSGADYITKTASNTLSGTSEANATLVVKRSGTTIATATANGSGVWTSTAFTLNEGLQDLAVTATDAHANSAGPVTRTNIRLDTVLPVTTETVSACTTGLVGWCKNASRTISFTGTDAGSGINTREVQNGSTTWTTYTGTTLTIGQVDDYVMTYRARDVAGNDSFQTETFYNDNVAPVQTIAEPSSPWYSSLTSLRNALSARCSDMAACGTSTDATSGIAGVGSVEWKLIREGGNCYTTGWVSSCSSYAFQDATGALPNWTMPMSSNIYSGNKDYTGTVQTTDRAGNVTSFGGTFSIN